MDRSPDGPIAQSLHDPRREYAVRLDARRDLAARCHRRHIQLGNWRLVVVVCAVVIAWLAFRRGALSPWWLAAPVGIFTALAIVHDRVIRTLQRAGRAVQFYTRGLERLDDRWAGAGESGERFLDRDHPYAEDLDLFGKGSLFELLSTARTRAGEETLASWLLHPASPEAVLERQAAVAELRSSLDLREDLAVLGETVRSGVHPELLAAWGEQPPVLHSRRLRAIAAMLPLILIASVYAWYQTGNTLFWSAILIQAIFAFSLRARVLRVVQAVELPAHDLALLAEVLRRIERERFTSPLLIRLRAALDVEGQPPSQRIARLKRLTELLDSRDNVAVRIFGPVVLWTTHLVFAIENWRIHNGPAVRRWLAALGEIEALSSLAGYACEHPGDPFPEFSGDAPCFDGEALGHPLLPERRSVRNDVRLGRRLRLLIVSGSNMSGKSTLLRTVGTNAVLAMAGAPVRARRLRLSPLAAGAAIQMWDSLQAGASRFYAEITRIRRLMDIASGPVPLLFLLDELLHGTNSHDRRIGAEAIVRGLLDRGAIGLITTHDLALAHIAEAVAPQAANVHFQDHLEDGKISFDYVLRPGVVEKSNALELMRSIGLDV